MSTLSSVRLPLPKDWPDFERKICELFKLSLNDPNTQMNGRQGQSQSGVDVIGSRDQSPQSHVGVQCKLTYSGAIEEKELRSELEKAKTFVPPLTEFFLVTTAPRDAKIQAVARELTLKEAAAGRNLRVITWGWEDIEAEAAKHADAWRVFDPTFNSFAAQSHEQLLAAMSEFKQQLSLLQPNLSTEVQSRTSVAKAEHDEHTPRHGKISAFQSLIEAGEPVTALAQLEQLRAQEWNDASPSEKYRLNVGIASANWRLGNIEEAGQMLLDAQQEYPSHRKAKLNAAKGHLLLNHPDKARETAIEALGQSEDAEAAGIVVQTSDNASDPLALIPPSLHQNADVVLGLLVFKRSKHDITWIADALTAEKQHEQNESILQFAAEARMERILNANPGLIVGSISMSGEFGELKVAAKTLLKLATTVISKKYRLAAPLASNTALALRLTGQEDKAADILDAAITQNPADENLRLHRAAMAIVSGDARKVLDLLPQSSGNPEVRCLRADAQLSVGNPQAALESLTDLNTESLNQNLRWAATSIRARALYRQDEAAAALSFLQKEREREPEDLHLRVMQIQLVKRIEGTNNASQLLDGALDRVTTQTDYISRLQLAIAANELDRYDAVVSLLDGNVALDHQNDGLALLVSALINGNYPKKAKELLDGLHGDVNENPEIQRAKAILAINTGDPKAEELLDKYLNIRPADFQAVVLKIRILQRQNRAKEIQALLSNIDFAQVINPEIAITLAAFTIHYGDPQRGLSYGYKILLANWSNPQIHLFYQGLILANDKLGDAIPTLTTVVKNAAVELSNDLGEARKYRIEDERPEVFGSEYLAPGDDLASILYGKAPGEEVKINEQVSARTWKVKSVKHIWIDALHRSLLEFNDRFPKAPGLLRLNVNVNSAEPFEEMKEIVKAQAEAGERALNTYEKNVFPLAFMAALIGKNPIEAWEGLPTLGRDVRVCTGLRKERGQAVQLVLEREPKGCVIDSITLVVMRRLKIAEVVRSICGPICTTETVLDLLRFRKVEAEHAGESDRGAVAYQNGKLVFEKYTPEMLRHRANECTADYDWAVRECKIVPAVPKEDLNDQQRTIVERLPAHVIDPALAAQGADLLLVSEDMGYRAWAGTLGVKGVWLQPILLAAIERKKIESIEYSRILNKLALSRHSYISLDSGCLAQQFADDAYKVTPQLEVLLHILGAGNADLDSNTSVAAKFLNIVYQQSLPEADKLKVTSAVFEAITIKHVADRIDIVKLIANRTQKVFRRTIYNHAISWLVGHSFGLPELSSLLQEVRLNR